MFRFTIAIQIICLVLSLLFGSYANAHELTDTDDVLVVKIAATISSRLNFADDKTIVECLKRLQQRDTQQDFSDCAKLLVQALKNSDDDSSTALLCWHLLIELADPSQINQGLHNTCALAALEKILCYNLPSLLCNLVLQAHTGKIKLLDGRELVLPGANLKPDSESRSFRPGTSSRSYAGQLFQIAAANVYWQSQNVDPRGMRVNPGSITYAQDFERESGIIGDTGERVLIRWSENFSEPLGDAAVCPLSGPCFDLDKIAKTFQLLTGKTTCPALLVYKSRGAGTNVTRFGSEDNLRSNLLQLKLQGQLPAIVSINPAKLSLHEAQSCKLDGGGRIIYLQGFYDADTWHVVCIVDYDQSRDLVTVDNSWGPSAGGKSKSQSVHSLFTSSLPHTFPNSDSSAQANHRHLLTLNKNSVD